jgi:muramoyltetrapeptide carboxypeptidase
MKIPPYLKAGDLVAIVATARKISVEECAPAVTWLQNLGLRVRLGSSIGLADRQFAGTDAERLADLQRQFDDAEVRAVLCARGGYGSVRLVDGLRWDGFDASPKWLCGFSDITVLHAALQSRGYASIHSTMPVNFKEEPEALASWQSLWAALKGQEIVYPQNDLVWARGNHLQGTVMGGNLSVLYSLLGSATLPDFQGRVLFLEDLDEYLYHLDRMMQALRRAGKLEGLAGLVVGGLTQMNDNAIGFGRTAEEILLDAVAAYDYPMLFGFPAGHQPLNLALRMGMPLQLQKS